MASFDEILLSELDTDPESMGYAAAGWSSIPDSSQYQAIADLINDKTRTEDRSDVPASEILAAVVPADYLEVFATSGDPTHRAYWVDMLTAGGVVDLENTNIRTALSTIFFGRSSTLAAINALKTSPISRAEELNLHFVKVGDLRRLKGDVT